jgi:hypothetical protein
MKARRRLFLTGMIALLSAASFFVFVTDGAAADPQDAGRDASLMPQDAGGVDSRAKIPPDPAALTERMQWVFDLRWERGEVYLVQVHKIDMGSNHPTPRMMGRFALELFEGPTLVERARFDFPMLGGSAEAPPDAGWKGAPPRFEAKLKTRIGVIFPATKRGNRLELWDRATDKRWPLPWPPQEGVYGGDAGLAVPRP